MKYPKRILASALGLLGIVTLTGQTGTSAAPKDTLDLSGVRVAADSCSVVEADEAAESDDDILFAGCGGVS